MMRQVRTQAPDYVGLLRGVNVGGKNKMPMVELRVLFESAGFSDVRTFIQSGNVIFKSKQKPTSSFLEAAIAKRFAIMTNVVLRTSSEIRTVLKHNPFPIDEEARVYVGFMAQKPSAAMVDALDHERFGAERFAIVGAETYLYLPLGMGQSKLPSYLDRQLKIPTTVRNWNTVNKLIELTSR
jgi:uncharacterized protein (DUF1697 family)